MALCEKGVSGNPAGRPKGLLTGRAKALYAMDQVVAKEENLALIEDALEKTLREKPMWFFVNIVMPLLPKETKGVLEAGDKVIEWKSLVSTAMADETKEELGIRS
jgi:hypothetical protein